MEKEEILNSLNEEQREAALAVTGPVLILAGAGSGKTRVLVHRVAYMIDVLGIAPGNILAITFTNKAADEMRTRVDKMIGFGAREIWVSTFHSLCVRILREHADLIGFTRYFSIYDTDDQLSLVKNIFHEKNIDREKVKEKGVLARISRAKDELVTPEKYLLLNKDPFGQMVGEAYAAYQKKLMENNAMDFDDLLMKTVELFEAHPDVLGIYQDRFRYMMVDEYQDTNTAQFRFVSLLAAKYRNLCVVGDDDQSIYKFRGANIRNILEFEKVFPDAKVVKLERNYRSTKNILDAANEVIKRNHGRKAKKLWTDNTGGAKVRLRRFDNGFEEAEFVAEEISGAVHRGARRYSDFAVLYRTNAQSRLFEEKMIFANVPYRIVGGVNFYSRREIKDLLAYLKTIDNGRDDLSVQRIINVPKRGIGATTISKLNAFAEYENLSFLEAACRAGSIPSMSAAAAKKVTAFTDFIGVLRAKAEGASVSAILKTVIDETGYVDALRAEHTEEADARIENIDELVSKAVQYEESAENVTLSGFLEEVALIADIDEVDASDDRVLLMTLHAAKGLEFPVVYMAGMEEGLFPSAMSINAERPEEEIEEERRLCYVGITRAKEELTFTSARERMIRGDVVRVSLSRFVTEIPREMIDVDGEDDFDASSSCNNAFGSYGSRGRRSGGFSSGMRNGPGGQGYGTGSGALSSGMRSAILGEPDYGRSPYRSSASGRKPSSDPFSENPYKKAPASKKGTGTDPSDLAVGDTVHHVKFGDGKILQVQSSGKGPVVTVDFPGWGTKKLIAAFAHLTKV